MNLLLLSGVIASGILSQRRAELREEKSPLLEYGLVPWGSHTQKEETCRWRKMTEGLSTCFGVKDQKGCSL